MCLVSRLDPNGYSSEWLRFSVDYPIEIDSKADVAREGTAPDLAGGYRHGPGYQLPVPVRADSPSTAGERDVRSHGAKLSRANC